MILIRSAPNLAPACYPNAYYLVANQNTINNLTPATENGTKDVQNNKLGQTQHGLPVYNITNVRVSQQETSIILSMDVPGIKAQDMRIFENDFTLVVEAMRRKNGETAINETSECNFYRQFSLDKKSLDPSGIKASLARGSLSVVIPKKPVTEPVEIFTLPSEPPAHEGAVFLRLDLPGVKLDDLRIKLIGDELNISAERKTGSSTFSIKKTFTVDEDKIHTKQMQAYLLDGVLSLSAPVKQGENDSMKGTNERCFVVNIDSQE